MDERLHTGMEEPTSCRRCGGALVHGTCPACDRDVAFTFVNRELVALIVLGGVAILGFVLTGAAAEANRALRLRDAGAWYAAGEDHLAAGRTDAAIQALRRATAINREDRRYPLGLAAALAADRQDAAAKQVLTRIRESTPEDPEVNIQLARLDARNDDLDGAVRHYESALYGMWGADRGNARRELRTELIRYLLRHDRRAHALSELLVLSGNLPDDARSQTEAGRLFLDAGEPRRALEHFQRSLRAEPENQAAVAGAGEAAFEAGDYTGAQRYLRSVTSPSDHVSEILAITALVLTRDPLRPGLSFRARRERTMLAFQRATTVLDECLIGQRAADQATDHDLQSLRDEAMAFEPELAVARLRRSPNAFEAAVDLVYRIEQRVVEACGRASVFDRALLLVGRRYEAGRP